MINSKKEFFLLKRLFIWFLYLFSGYILYSKKGYLFSFLIFFTKLIYPLSIFWIQIRINRKSNFLPVDSSMGTSQLWFNILPVMASLITVFLSLINLLFYIIDEFVYPQKFSYTSFYLINKQLYLIQKTFCKDSCLFI